MKRHSSEQTQQWLASLKVPQPIKLTVYANTPVIVESSMNKEVNTISNP